jgi:hypothetical protein
MGKRTDNIQKIFKILRELKESHPNYTIGMHIATAFGDYKIEDLWSTPDREFLFSLEKYQTELEIDATQIAPDDYVYLIEKDAKENLFGNINDEEEDI